MDGPKPKGGALGPWKVPAYVEPTPAALAVKRQLTHMKPTEVAAHPSLVAGSDDQMDGMVADAFLGPHSYPTAQQYVEKFSHGEDSPRLKQYVLDVAYELYPQGSLPLLDPAQQEAHRLSHEEEVVLNIRAEVLQHLTEPERLVFMEEMSRFDLRRVQHRLLCVQDPTQVDWEELGRIAGHSIPKTRQTD